VNLKSHRFPFGVCKYKPRNPGREQVVRGFRRDTVRLNSPGQIFDYPGQEAEQARIACAVMRTRRGLDGPTAARMTLRLWECED